MDMVCIVRCCSIDVLFFKSNHIFFYKNKNVLSFIVDFSRYYWHQRRWC